MEFTHGYPEFEIVRKFLKRIRRKIKEAEDDEEKSRGV